MVDQNFRGKNLFNIYSDNYLGGYLPQSTLEDHLFILYVNCSCLTLGSYALPGAEVTGLYNSLPLYFI